MLALRPSSHYEIYKRFFEAVDCFTEDERIPKVSYMLTAMQYGTPLISASLSEVDEGKAPKDRTYPTDSEYVVALLKDIIDHVDT